MSEKKVVRRTVAIALGIVCILLIAGLGGAMAYYTMTINNKDSTYDSYASSHSHTDSDYNALNSTYYNYVGNHTHSNSEYNSLQSDYTNYVAAHHHIDSEYNSLIVASLTTVGLDVTNFNHYWPWDPPSHLTIKGYIFNMGTDTAYNCKLHVKVWSSTDTLLLDTTVDLGSISGRSYVYKSTETPYTGSGSYWEVISEWTTTP